MVDEIQQVTEGVVTAFLGWPGRWWHSVRQKQDLKGMLRDKRFLKGFRSFAQLRDGIGADDATTKRLLLAIGARKSETSDEWKLGR